MFKNKLAISGDIAKIKLLIPKLEALGYHWAAIDRDDYDQYPFLLTHYDGEGLGFFTPDEDNLQLNVDNEDLILALAAMHDDDVPHVGEIWKMTDAGGWSYSPRNNGCFSIVTRVSERRLHGNDAPVPAIGGKTLNPIENDHWATFIEIPIFDRTRIICEKATVQEIYNYFKQTEMKETKTAEILGYRLNGKATPQEVANLLGCSSTTWSDQGNAFFLQRHFEGDYFKKAKELGILDLWFEPVYEDDSKRVKVGDIVIVTSSGTLQMLEELVKLRRLMKMTLTNTVWNQCLMVTMMLAGLKM